MKNLLFIPCYRCAPQIVRVLDKLGHLIHFFDEVLIIDNISPDQTGQVASEFVRKNLLPRTRVLQNPANVGLGGSHKLAFSHAIENGFDHVVILHGDDQGELNDFHSVLEMAKQTELKEFYFGARFHPRSRLSGYAPFRILGNLVFNFLGSILTTQSIYDLGGSGLNLFPVKLLKEHSFRKYANDLTFHVFLLLNAVRLKQRLVFIPVSWKEDDQISNVKLFAQSVKLIKILGSYLVHPQNVLEEKLMSFPHRPEDWKQLTEIR